MNVHHIEGTSSFDLENLATLCVACHAVLHIGLNLQYEKIGIWASELSQVEIIQLTRSMVKDDWSLDEIRDKLKLSEGPYPPDAMNYASDLIDQMGDSPRAYLDEPLCAVFIDFSRWQIE